MRALAKTDRRRHPNSSVARCLAPHSPVQTRTLLNNPGLVRVPGKPWRSGLPIGHSGPLIADRHLDLRQIILVEDLALRDYLVEGEQVGRQRKYLIGAKNPLIPKRHAATDVIKQDRRIRR